MILLFDLVHCFNSFILTVVLFRNSLTLEGNSCLVMFCWSSTGLLLFMGLQLFMSAVVKTLFESSLNLCDLL